MSLLQKYEIKTMPKGYGFDKSHLQRGCQVAITKQGLDEHNQHNMFNMIAVGGGIGLIALPVLLGGGGIGLAFGGEAVGLGLAEVAAVGGMTGGTIGKLTTNPITGHRSKFKNVQLIDMLGYVREWSRRWWDQPGWDVRVEWIALDESGRKIRFDAWHDPDRLVRMVKR